MAIVGGTYTFDVLAVVIRSTLWRAVQRIGHNFALSKIKLVIKLHHSHSRHLGCEHANVVQ
jgi:hypothetical protein